MPRPRPLVPTYKLYKPSGQAYTTVGDRGVYVGVYGTQASREKAADLRIGSASRPPRSARHPLSHPERDPRRPLDPSAAGQMPPEVTITTGG